MRREQASFSVKCVEVGRNRSIPRIFRLPPFICQGKMSRGPPDHQGRATHPSCLGIVWQGRATPQSFWSYQPPELCWKKFRAVQFFWLLTHCQTPGTYSGAGDIYLAACSFLEKQHEILALTPSCWLKIEPFSVCLAD